MFKWKFNFFVLSVLLVTVQLVTTDALYANVDLKIKQDHSEAYFGHSKHTNGQPTFFESPKNAPVVGRTPKDIEAFLNKTARKYFGMGEHDTFILEDAKPGPSDTLFFTAQQTYKDLPVFDNKMTVEVNTAGQVTFLSGMFTGEIQLAGKPKIPKSRLNQPKYFPPKAKKIKIHKASLGIDVRGKQPRYAYEVDATFTHKGRVKNQLIYVDANSGEVLHSYDLEQHSLKREIYHSGHPHCMTMPHQLESNTKLADEKGLYATGDIHAKALFDNMGDVYWFYNHFFDRDSWDNKGVKILVGAHGRFHGENTCKGIDLGAFFMRDRFFFGDPLSTMPDVAGHEFSHGVIATTSQLIYHGESGALNEAFADAMGVTASVWIKSGGSSSGNPQTFSTELSDYEIGEGDWVLRYMYDPAIDGVSADTYENRTCDPKDHCSVHTNSGIINLAFYLMAEGGKHPKYPDREAVRGIGIEKAAKIFYHANDLLFHPKTDFSQARQYLARIAKLMHSECSLELNAVQRAFDSVNIPGSWEECYEPSQESERSTDESSGASDNIITFDAKSVGYLILLFGIFIVLISITLMFYGRRACSSRSVSTIGQQSGSDKLPSKPVMITATKNQEKITSLTINLLEDRSLTIGRREDLCDWVIDCDSVSRKHLLLSIHKGHMTAKDLNSGNGVVINGHKLKPFSDVPITLSDHIQIGDVSLNFDIL